MSYVYYRPSIAIYYSYFYRVRCIYTNGLHDELTGLSPLRPNRILSTGNGPHRALSSADAYSVSPDVRAVDDTPWEI